MEDYSALWNQTCLTGRQKVPKKNKSLTEIRPIGIMSAESIKKL